MEPEVSDDNVFTLPPPAGGPAEAPTRTRWPANAPAPPPPENQEFTLRPPTKSTVGTGEDVAKSAGTQAVFGLGDVAGLPGTLGSFVEGGAKWVGEKVLQGADKLGLLPGEHTPETVPKAVGEWVDKNLVTPEGRKYAEKYGNRADIGLTSAPTGDDIEKELRAKIPALDYTPQTKAGEYAGSASRMATNSLAGGPGRTLVEKGVVGAVSGLGSEAAGDAAKATGLGDYEGVARFFGGVLSNSAAMRTAGGIRSFTNGNAEAEHRLAQALQEDLRDGRAKMTPQQIDEAISQGHSPSVFDMAGPRTEELLSKMGGMAQGQLGHMNAGVNARNDAMRSANGRHITDTFGLTNRAGDEMTAMQLAHKRQNDQLYTFARNNPTANFVTTPRLEELAGYPGVKEAVARVTKLAEDPQFGIRPPTAAPNFGGPPMAPTPGNLAFWDHVKRDIDSQVSTLKRSGGDAHYLDTWRKELLQEVDSQVTGYDKARAAARVGFQAEDALEAGTKFAAKPNSFQTAEIKKALANFTPEERDLFIKGVGDALLTKAQSSPQAFTRFLTAPENTERLRTALGDARYNQLHGYARSTELMSNAATIAATPPKTGMLVGHAGLAAGIAAALPELGYMMSLPPQIASKVIAGAAFDAASKGIKYAAERRVAPEVIRLAQSTDPADLARLGHLLQSNPAANAYFSRVTTALAELGATAVRSNAGMQDVPRPQRAEGGRIGTLNHVMLAAGLIRAAEKAKKGHGQTTEPLLKQTDEAITKALSIANEAI
jgi:hypothetical protein